jgi:oligopeptide/dipeptide ABC transporter ATP-binding protein
MMLLDVRDLHLGAPAATGTGVLRLLDNVSFRLVKGRILGLLGEPGAGKTLLANALVGLARPPAVVSAGRAVFDGQDLLHLAEGDLDRLRGNRIGLVPQAVRAVLEPLMRIGPQLLRAQEAHRHSSRAEAVWRVETILASVGVAAARARTHAWPHELPDTVIHRVVLAMALINEPQLLIVDEPGDGLDVTVRPQLLDVIYSDTRRRRIGTVLMTREPGIVAQYCDDIVVMFAGQVVEQGPVRNVFARPLHPYTRALLAATVERYRPGEQRRAAAVPDRAALPQGCIFRGLCPDETERCLTPPVYAGSTTHAARCHFVHKAAA